MPPKDDPETAALKKELTDLIAKFQVGIFTIFNNKNRKTEKIYN